MKSIITIFIFLLVSFPTLGMDQCEKYLDDCEYYTCIHYKKNCGRRSYFDGFGKKFCNKFTNKSPKFTPMGQEWIVKAKSCLIDKIHELDANFSCKQFKKLTIKHHVPCYLESGYCSLPAKDKRRVARIVIKSMWRPGLIRSALKVLNSCRKK